MKRNDSSLFSDDSSMCAKSPRATVRGLTALLVSAVAICACLMLAACSSNSSGSASEEQDNSPVRIGTMPTEDFLPMWAAEKDGDFGKAGVNAEIVSFDSAQALSAAIAAGEIDMAMVDIPRAVKLCESGTPVAIEWITLGTEASQGAFGVLAPKDAPYSNLSELAAYFRENGSSAHGVGLAANTVPEYVFEMLCKQEGVDPSEMVVEEVASLPERYSLVSSGNLAAAALPASLLRLGEASGLKVIAEDTEGENISQSIMIATESFAKDNEEKVMEVARAWDMAAEAIDADPEAYSMLLAEKANLNEAIAETYPVPTYPMATEDDQLCHPSAELVDKQLDWMESKEYISKNITYNPSSGTFTVE